MKPNAYHPSNPTMHRSIWSHIKTGNEHSTVMKENRTLLKTLISLAVVITCMSITWHISETIPVEAIVLLFLGGALTVAFAMVFPSASWILTTLFSIILGASLGALGAGVGRELGSTGVGGVISSLVNVSIVVSITTLTVMAILRRFYILSTIHRTGSIIIGALCGFFASFAMMRILSWIYSSGKIPMYYDSYQGYNIIFGAMIAIFMAASTVYHLRMIRQNEHRRYPQYMEWYMALGFVFSLVWFYNECLNMILSRHDDTSPTQTPHKK